jgi:nitronate monooxygenase
MGTRFLATNESSASPAYKQAVVDATDADILVADRPGSPCGLPFRVLKDSPMYRATLSGERAPRCDKGYVLRRDANGSYLRCPTMDDVRAFFCICNGLLSSGGYNPDDEQPLYTVGATASRVDRIMSVGDLMGELTGAPA